MKNKGFTKWTNKLNRSSMTLTATSGSVFSLAGRTMKQICITLINGLIRVLSTLKKVKGFLITGLRTKKTWANVNGL